MNPPLHHHYNIITSSLHHHYIIYFSFCRSYYTEQSVMCHPVYGEVFSYLLGKLQCKCRHFVIEPSLLTSLKPCTSVSYITILVKLVYVAITKQNGPKDKLTQLFKLAEWYYLALPLPTHTRSIFCSYQCRHRVKAPLQLNTLARGLLVRDSLS